MCCVYKLQGLKKGICAQVVVETKDMAGTIQRRTADRSNNNLSPEVDQNTVHGKSSEGACQGRV